MSEISHPHDLLFKSSLHEKQIAVDFLKAHLPPAVFKRLDLDTLHLTNKSLGIPNLGAMHCDMVYACKIDGKSGYVPMLLRVEHISSTVRARMAFYLLQGSINLMAQHIKEGHDKLPLVIPVCVYHGTQTPFPQSTDIYDHFEDPELARELVFKPFTLVDLNTLSESAVSQHGTVALMELLFKQYQAKEFLSVLKRAVSSGIWKLTALHTTDTYLLDVLEYVSQVGDYALPTGELLKMLAEDLPEKKREIVMKFGDDLRQEGYQLGLKAAHQEAWREAEHCAKLETARTMLSRGFDINSIREITQLTEDDLTALGIS